MNNILYEVPTKFQFDYIHDVLMIGDFAGLLFVTRKSNKEKFDEVKYAITKLIAVFGFCFTLFFVAVNLYSSADMYKKIVGGYESGNYEIVEGYIENFVPMPYEGHGEESFEINGVQFSYSDYNLHSGYNNTKSHGGVIEGDGQHLKIGYVYYNSTYGNIIVYIEQLE